MKERKLRTGEAGKVSTEIRIPSFSLSSPNPALNTFGICFWKRRQRNRVFIAATPTPKKKKKAFAQLRCFPTNACLPSTCPRVFYFYYRNVRCNMTTRFIESGQYEKEAGSLVFRQQIWLKFNWHVIHNSRT